MEAFEPTMQPASAAESRCRGAGSVLSPRALCHRIFALLYAVK